MRLCFEVKQSEEIIGIEFRERALAQHAPGSRFFLKSGCWFSDAQSPGVATRGGNSLSHPCVPQPAFSFFISPPGMWVCDLLSLPGYGNVLESIKH